MYVDTYVDTLILVKGHIIVSHFGIDLKALCLFFFILHNHFGLNTYKHSQLFVIEFQRTTTSGLEVYLRALIYPVPLCGHRGCLANHFFMEIVADHFENNKPLLS